MTRFKTFLNGATITHTDLNNIQDDYEFIYSTWRNVLNKTGRGGVLNSASTYFLDTGFLVSTGQGDYATLKCHRKFDPLDFNSSYRTTQFRITGKLITNNVAPAANFFLNIYSNPSYVSLPFGAGTGIVAASVHADTSVGIVTPGATSITDFTSNTFSLSAISDYIIGIRSSVNTAASSQIAVIAHLQYNRI